MFVSLGAILVVGVESSGSKQLTVEGMRAAPLACVEVVGESVLQGTVRRLRRQGLGTITVVAEDSVARMVPGLAAQSVAAHLVHSPADVWLAANRTLAEYAASGVERVLLAQLGAYVEFELAGLLEFHRETSQAVTRLYDGEGQLDFWMLDTAKVCHSRFGSNGSSSLQRGIRIAPYHFPGYVRRLEEPGDLRRLTVDALLGRCAIQPPGQELKPGVWADEGARVHRRARIVAPAYIGKRARIEAGALITRCSSVERGSWVDYGTAVEDASILPNTYVGACLDVAHAVVCGNQLIALRREVAVEINDTALLDSSSPSAARGLSLADRGLAALSLRPARSLHGTQHQGQPAFVPSESNP